MLFETASHELPLLIFTLLVPMGLAGSSLVFLARGLGGESRSSKKLDTLGVVPVAFLVVGLIASFFHLGSPQRAFGMVGGLGTSPLSNEIVVAGASIAVAVVLWIVSVAKHPEGKIQLYFGVMMGVLALASAVFTGLAYAIPTIIVWNSPCGWISQVFLALAGGASICRVGAFDCWGKRLHDRQDRFGLRHRWRRRGGYHGARTGRHCRRCAQLGRHDARKRYGLVLDLRCYRRDSGLRGRCAGCCGLREIVEPETGRCCNRARGQRCGIRSHSRMLLWNVSHGGPCVIALSDV